jgi:hypothetical protein
MSTGARELRPMFSSILRSLRSCMIALPTILKPGQERKKPTTEKIPSRYLMGQSLGLRVRRMGNVLGG